MGNWVSTAEVKGSRTNSLSTLSTLATLEQGEVSSILCILCRGSVLFFDSCPKAKLNRHLQYEHGALYGQDYMLASCRMTEEDRSVLEQMYNCDPKEDSKSKHEDKAKEAEIKSKENAIKNINIKQESINEITVSKKTKDKAQQRKELIEAKNEQPKEGFSDKDKANKTKVRKEDNKNVKVSKGKDTTKEKETKESELDKRDILNSVS